MLAACVASYPCYSVTMATDANYAAFGQKGQEPKLRAVRTITSHECTLASHVRGLTWCRDSEEYKRWKAFQEAEASGDAAGAQAALTELKLRDKDGNEIEKQLPGGKARSRPASFLMRGNAHGVSLAILSL